MKYIQKAAMFGLDARIALAIFGTLSIIGGAALYNSLEEAKVTAIIAELEEVGKAYDQYLLDTGLELEIVSDEKYLNTDKLIENVTVPTAGWKGPYLSYSAFSKNSMKHPIYSKVFIVKADGCYGCSIIACAGINPCYVWVGMVGIPLDLMKKLDKKIDNGDGRTVGNFRYWDDVKFIFYKYRPVLHK